MDWSALPLDLALSLGSGRLDSAPARFGLQLSAYWWGYAKFRHILARLRELEANRQTMQITQVPADPKQWGLTSLIPGVPGRLGFKVNKIVVHWMDGTLASTDNVFAGKTGRKVSSHFGVEDGSVHQYVAVGNVAWHAGNWNANLTSVGIEHSAQPGRDASDATYETSSQLIVALCRQLGLTPSRGLLRRHSEFVATACPGTIDLDRLAARAVELWNPKGDVDQGPAAQGTVASAPKQVPTTFNVTVTATLRVRSLPTVSSQDHPDKLLRKGNTVEIAEAVQGERVNGNPVWLRTKVSGLYVWAGGTDYK